MSSAKTIAKSTGFLFSREIVDKLMSFFLVIIITRYLGDVGFGKYSFAFAFIALFLMFSHFGLTVYIFREIAKDRSKAKKLIGNVISLRLVLLTIVYAIAMIVAWFSPKTRAIMLLLFFVIVYETFKALNTLIKIILKAYERNEYNLYITFIDRAMALGLGSFVLISGYGIYNLVLALVFSKMITFVLYYFACSTKIVKISFDADLETWKHLIKNSIPFWLTLVFNQIYYQVDKVMLTAMKGYAVTGWYTAASTLINALTFVPGIIINATFPAMSRFHHQNSKDFLKMLYKKSFYYLLAIGLPMSIGITLLSQRLILFIYKEQFIESAVVLQILSWTLVLVFINYMMGYLLNAINKQHMFTISSAFCAVSNVAANFLLIPRFSYIGAAIATIVSQAINFILLYYYTSKNGFFLNLLSISYKPIISGLIMGITITYIAFLPIIYIIPIAAAIYFISLFLIRGIGKEEIRLVRSFLPKKP